jgi:Ca2+-binding RTX toxin-like protein
MITSKGAARARIEDDQASLSFTTLAAKDAFTYFPRHADRHPDGLVDDRASAPREISSDAGSEAAQIALTDQHIVGITNAGAQFAPAVAALPGSAYVIVWLDSDRGAVYGQLYDSGGQRTGTEFRVSSPGPSPLFASVAALDGGGFVVAWQAGSFSSADIHAQRYDGFGAPFGGEFTINSSLPNEQLNVRIIGLDGGGFLATWDSIVADQYQEISGRLFNSAGDPVGPDFTINTSLADSQGISSIAPLAGGGFVAIWQSVTPAGGNNVEIIGQRFAAGGTRIGGEFQVNTATANNQQGNDVARLSDGGFVVSWVDPVPGHGGGRVVARHYDANGNAIGGEIVIASKASGGFGSSVVTALADGAYVVAWTDNDGADDNVSARAMGANDLPLGGAFDVSSGAPFSSVLYPDGAVTLANGHVVFAWDGPSTGTSEDAYYRMYQISSAPDHFEGDSGDNNISGSTGADYFDLSQGGNDTASGLDGDDGFYFGAAFNAADHVDGGTGTNDQIGLQGDYTGGNALALGPNTIANIEVIVVLPGYSYDITTNQGNVAAGGVLKVQATQLAAGQNLHFNGAAETDGSFMIFGGHGDDNLTGGAGDDGFYFGPGGYSGSDVINGGAGANDQLALDGDYAITLGGNVTNVEALVLLHGPAATPNHFDITSGNAFVAAGQTMTIFALQVETAILFNGSGELDGAFKIYGGTNADTLTGGSGADWIFGGDGADGLTGGAGNDIFYYDAVGQSTAASGDIVFDFALGDKIDVSGIDAIAGGANDAFTYLGSGAFTNHAGELRIENQGGSTWLVQGDTNGDGAADFQLTFIAGDAHAITSADFTL